jgi:DNA-binding GntR family transcriptional regulator
MFGPTETGSVFVAHDRVYRALRSRILHGEIEPGASMTLRGLGRDFGVSMTPAREAVRTARLGRGAAVPLGLGSGSRRPSFRTTASRSWRRSGPCSNPNWQARALPRAHFGADRADGAINTGIAQMIARQRCGRATSVLNLEFHRTLYLRAQSPAMLALTETVWLQLGPTMRALYARLRRSEPPQHHRLIIAALKAGDEPGLRLAVRADVTHGLRLLAA